MLSIIIPTLRQKNENWEEYHKLIVENIITLKEEIEKTFNSWEIITIEWKLVNEAWNEWVERAKWEYVMIINDDIIIYPWTFEKFKIFADKWQIWCPYFTRANDFDKVYTSNNDNIVGFCFWFKKEFSKFPIPENLKIWYWDNYLYHKHNKNIGWWGKIHHWESRTVLWEEHRTRINELIEQDKIERPKVLRQIIRLSILIPSMPNRMHYLQKLLDKLLPQIQWRNDIELIVLTDNRKTTIWEKRNRLINIAKWDYIVWIDDDDDISEDYVEQLIKAMRNFPDCITFDMEVSIDWWEYKKVYFSKDHEHKDLENCYYRKPHWLMCYRKDVAIKERFSDIVFREDTDYAERIYKHIKTEVNIPKTLYYYNYISNKN